MENMNGGKALMKSLEKEGVKEVFGLPGGANLPMYDELFKSNIRHILARHEQSAAHMADGYGRVSRKPGVCFATSGPGATNLLTGIATAQADSAPMIAVTGQVPVKMIGKDAFQETDIIQIEKAIDMLLAADKPIILAGGGVTISSAFAELQSISELLMIPVVTTFKGKGSFPENHPLSLGPIGMHGHAEANKLMTEADCVLAIGTRFSDRSVGTFEAFEKRLKIIHMDVDPAEIGKNQTTSVAVVGDVRASLRIMVKMLMQYAIKKTDENKWLKHVKETKENWQKNLKMHPGEMSAAKILRKLRDVLPHEAIVTTEVGQHQMWASLFFNV